MVDEKGFGMNVVGYYAYDSNRLIAYQQNLSWRDDEEDWIETMDTIVHEAVHQTACNCGIHSRLYNNPRWVVEGLATVFEAKGINNYFKHSDFNSRINYDRLKSLKRYYKNGKMRNRVGDIVTSDEIFRSDPELAYGLAWGLSFYLSQRQPHLYVQYLEKLQEHEKTSSFGSTNRLKYFEQTFGPIQRGEPWKIRSWKDGQSFRRCLLHRRGKQSSRPDPNRDWFPLDRDHRKRRLII